jgi:hypothetical protein
MTILQTGPVQSLEPPAPVACTRTQYIFPAVSPGIDVRALVTTGVSVNAPVGLSAYCTEKLVEFAPLRWKRTSSPSGISLVRPHVERSFHRHDGLLAFTASKPELKSTSRSPLAVSCT